MKRLQVLQPDGSWTWVFCRKGETGELMTTDNKAKALGDVAFREDDLAWARKTWPERTFRLAETLES